MISWRDAKRRGLGGCRGVVISAFIELVVFVFLLASILAILVIADGARR